MIEPWMSTAFTRYSVWLRDTRRKRYIHRAPASTSHSREFTRYRVWLWDTRRERYIHIDRALDSTAFTRYSVWLRDTRRDTLIESGCVTRGAKGQP